MHLISLLWLQFISNLYIISLPASVSVGRDVEEPPLSPAPEAAGKDREDVESEPLRLAKVNNWSPYTEPDSLASLPRMELRGVRSRSLT